ncbi:MAG TPA: hypothetical protein ENI23_03930 [bacterium]|nr:hypothetical protein [bacterium]
MGIEKLQQFVWDASKKTYASSDSSLQISEDDHSSTLPFEDGDFRYHDNFFGGEPYGGREVVFFKEEPVWIMVYYGYVVPEFEDHDAVYAFLQKALRESTLEKPYRGPDNFTDGDLEYVNEVEGEFENFHGVEKIMHKGKVCWRIG